MTPIVVKEARIPELIIIRINLAAHSTIAAFIVSGTRKAWSYTRGTSKSHKMGVSVDLSLAKFKFTRFRLERTKTN